jgi:hypothetical protein
VVVFIQQSEYAVKLITKVFCSFVGLKKRIDGKKTNKGEKH